MVSADTFRDFSSSFAGIALGRTIAAQPRATAGDDQTWAPPGPFDFTLAKSSLLHHNPGLLFKFPCLHPRTGVNVTYLPLLAICGFVTARNPSVSTLAVQLDSQCSGRGTTESRVLSTRPLALSQL